MEDSGLQNDMSVAFRLANRFVCKLLQEGGQSGSEYHMPSASAGCVPFTQLGLGSLDLCSGSS